jgi:hypothetical protein
MEELKYPIGKFEYGKSYSYADNKNHISNLEEFPKVLKPLALSLTDAQLEQPYRPGGWTGRQVIHHIADSHMNGFIRLKLTLTEDAPVIKPYHEELFAELTDGKSAPIESSLAIIDAVHQRWVYLLKSLSEEDLQRKYIHPQYNREFKLNEFLALYAWHGKHHYGHLKLITGK